LVAGSHCADGSFGELNFEDAEFTNGVRAPGYDDYDTDTDVTTIGGTFPMIGVGGAAIGTPCELVFTVPLTRLCAADAPANVVASYTGAYPHLADYNVDPYRCNNAFFDVDGGAPGSCGDTGLSGFYWPWDRLNGNNPHRQSGGGQVVEANIATSTTLDITVETPVLADMGGGEINTYTVCNQSGGPITDGIFTITVPPNVTLDASVPALTLDGVTSLGTIYSIDLTEGTADGNCFEFELTTTLVYCDDTSICASALPCGADVELVAAKMLDCVASECYNYQGGSNGLTSAIMFSNVAPCSTSPYVLDLFNTGTGFLNNVNAVVYLPAGATPALPFTVTSSTGASTTIPAAEDPAFTGADGIAYVLDAAALAAFLGPDGLDPEEGLTITTDVTFACDFISGGTPALLVEADGDCIPFEHTNTGAPINTLPPADEPTFVFQSDDLQLSCSSGGAEVVVTGLNTSKSESENTRICIQVPEGLTLTMGDISAVAPTGYMPTNLTTTPLGTSGDMEISFDGPMSVAPGEFFCLSLMFTVDDLECGIYEVGIQAKSITEVDCNGMVCDMSSIAAEAVLPFEVVPAAAIGEANLYAGCNADPTMTDLDFEIILESVGTTYNGDIDVELFFDLDDNGIVDPYDTSLGEVAATAAIPAEGEGLVTGSISVPNEMACSIVAKLTIPGCACSMVFIPFPEVAPAFLGELGDAVAVCPGDPLIIEEVCGDVMIEFVPAGAGTVVIDPVGETATVMLNDGFGVAAPVQLKTTFSAGPCSDQMFFTDIQSVGDFDFGPYEVFSCNDLTTQIDLMIPPALQSNIDVLITPALYLDDPTIIDPSFINPAANQSYVVEFSLNGACMSATTLDLIVTERAEITVEGNFMMCDTIFDLDGIVEIDPEVGAEWSTMGDGLFDNGAATADVASSPRHYAPGPADIAAGMVTLLIETMEGEPCGSSIARVEIEIIEDVTPPNITCPNNICVPNDPDWCGAMLNLPLILVEDDCTTSGPGTDPGDNNLVIEYNIDGGPWSTTDINNMFFDNGIATIGVRATDEAGNMSECFFTYEVKDKQAPDVICQDLVLDLGNNGPCETTITADQLGGLSTDECVDDVPLMIGLTSDDLGSTYEITGLTAPIDTTIQLLVVASDAAGNESTCVSNVRVICGVPESCETFMNSGDNLCSFIEMNPTHPLAALDCDGGGVDNATECAAGDDPYDAGDDYDCDNIADAPGGACAYILANPTLPIAMADCDGGGIDNLTECMFGTNPLPVVDGDDSGGDPAAADDCFAAAEADLDICAIIFADPTGALAMADCDGGGISNFDECVAGTNPLPTVSGLDDGSDDNAADDCLAAKALHIDICALIAADPTIGLATLDCDGGGVDNATECAAGGDPFLMADDSCDSFEASGIEIVVRLSKHQAWIYVSFWKTIRQVHLHS